MYIIAKVYENTMDYVDIRGGIVKDIVHCKNNGIAVCSPMVYRTERYIQKRLKIVGPNFKKIPLTKEILDFFE